MCLQLSLRSSIVISLVAASVAVVPATVDAIDEPLDLYLYVGPPVAGDAIPIPPQGRPSAFFVAELRFPAGVVPGAVAPPVKLYLFAGETKSRTSTFGDARTNLEVEIDPTGNRATVKIEIWRGDQLVLRQYQALWLTTDPQQRLPGRIPER